MSDVKNKLVTKTREQLFEMYMTALKENELPWEKPWKSSGIFNPVNPVSTTKYRGVNRILLSTVAYSRKLEDGRWATMSQIMDRTGKYHPKQKWHLRKGSKGVPVELWKVRRIGTNQLIDFREYNRIIEKDPDQAENYTLYSQTYTVFNYSDIDGAPELKNDNYHTVSIPELQEFCDEIVRNINVDLEHVGESAYYSPSLDKIVLPKMEWFKTSADYYATRLHETAHSTGAPQRMNRDLTGGFGSEAYAKEELRAEIASSFLFADLGMPTEAELLDNHKAYIQNWISVLEKDPNVLFSAIKDAEKISDYILSNAPVALKAIQESRKDTCQEFVKQSIKDDYAHQRINEKEYRYLTRNIDRISDSLRENLQGKTEDEKNKEYEVIKNSILTDAGLLVAETALLGKEMQKDPLNNTQILSM